jgi:hypothetical protein
MRCVVYIQNIITLQYCYHPAISLIQPTQEPTGEFTVSLTIPIMTPRVIRETSMKTKHRYLDEHTCEIWLYLHDYINENGIAPSYREIADHTFISVSTVQARLDWLEMREYIQRKQGIARSIVLLKSVEEAPELCEISSSPN